MNKGKNCPINEKLVNESVIRLIALQVVIITICIIFYQNSWLTVFLFCDFCIRAFLNPKWSLLRWNANLLVRIFRLTPRLSNEAPKRFAAQVGAVVIGSVTALQFFQIEFLFHLFASAIVLFALLESVFSICVGCWLYQKTTWLKA